MLHLIGERYNVHHAAHRIPRIPRFDRQSRNVHKVRLVGGLIEFGRHTLAEERENRPGDARAQRAHHHQQQDVARLLQRDGMVTSIGFGE